MTDNAIDHFAHLLMRSALNDFDSLDSLRITATCFSDTASMLDSLIDDARDDDDDELYAACAALTTADADAAITRCANALLALLA